jgi:hypothetical protein
MAMAGGTISRLFDPTTCSNSSPTAADQQSPAAFERPEDVFFFVPDNRPRGGGDFLFVPEIDELFLQPICVFIRPKIRTAPYPSTSYRDYRCSCRETLDLSWGLSHSRFFTFLYRRTQKESAALTK